MNRAPRPQWTTAAILKYLGVGGWVSHTMLRGAFREKSTAFTHEFMGSLVSGGAVEKRIEYGVKPKTFYKLAK